MDQRDEWVQRVLGVAIAARSEAGHAGGSGSESLAQAWTRPGAGAGGQPLSASAARAQEAAAVSRGRVNFRKVQLKWRAAEAEANSQLDAFAKTLLADPEVKADPKFAQLEASMKDIKSLIPTFSDDLSDELDQLDNAATPDERKAAHAAALDVISEYEADLAKAEGLRELQDLADDEYGGMAFFSALQLALAELRREVEHSA
jgi:hypothetical protein